LQAVFARARTFPRFLRVDQSVLLRRRRRRHHSRLIGSNANNNFGGHE
jgi:hypothetical protein